MKLKKLMKDAASKERIAGVKDKISTEVASVGADWYEERYAGNATVATDSLDGYIKSKLSLSTEIDGCTVSNTLSTDSKITVTYGVGKGQAKAEGLLSNGSLTWKWVAVAAQ